jgi:hypothetical protein
VYYIHVSAPLQDIWVRVLAHFVETSGASNFGDHPISGSPMDDVRTDKDDIFGWEKSNADGWVTRSVDIAVIEAGEKFNVQTVIINPPIICKCFCMTFNFQ